MKSKIIYAFVVVATTKVRIFKQITTLSNVDAISAPLLLLPQRYVFSSKSQLVFALTLLVEGCCCYHKGTYFQANHNTTMSYSMLQSVVVATTKVRIFKQITTHRVVNLSVHALLLLPQRYVFSSKSQRPDTLSSPGQSCCCYHKGTYFQANHNELCLLGLFPLVVVATTKVRIFKQITTMNHLDRMPKELLLLPQRYVFSSKSQPNISPDSCDFVVVATTKVRIFKQITTITMQFVNLSLLLLLPQRYVFSSKSQLTRTLLQFFVVVVATTKVRIFKQITTQPKDSLNYV